MRIYLMLIVGFIVTGCSTVPLSQYHLWQDPNADTAKVLLYRPSGSHTKAVKLYFGVDENYAVGLKEKQFTWLYIPVGKYTFLYKPPGYKAESSEIEISPEGINCLALKAGAKGWAKLLLSPAITGDVGFYSLIKGKCLDEKEINNYSYVDVKMQ